MSRFLFALVVTGSLVGCSGQQPRGYGRFEVPAAGYPVSVEPSGSDAVDALVCQLVSCSMEKMHTYLRVLSRDPAREQSPGFETFLRSCVAGAPGVVSITSVEPHSRGGFAVVIETVESLPRDFDDYFERSELMLVI